MSTQIKNSDFELYRYFKVAFSPLRNLLKSPDGSLYKLNITKLDVLVLVELHKFTNPVFYSDVTYQFC
jgi:hypothetical protein